MQIIKKLLYLLTPGERINAGLLILMTLIMALLDTIGVASILPFMAVLSNPSLVETNLILSYLFQSLKVFGVENNQQFLFALGVLAFTILVFSLAFKALTTFIQLRFVYMRGYSIGKRLVEGYLQQPYSWFLNRNSADLGKTILSEVHEIIGGGIRPMIELIAKSMVTIGILVLLFLTNIKLTIIVGFSLVGVYGLIYYFSSKYLYQIGKERLKNNQLRFTALSEAFGASKEIKVSMLEQFYIKKFSNSAKSFAQTTASSQIISFLPRFVLEAIAFGGIILLILYLMIHTGNFNDALPIISLYVFAGYRLIPAIQSIYVSLSSLAFVSPSLDKLYNDIKKLKSSNLDKDQDILPLKKTITLKNINFNYPNTSRKSLTNINLVIPIKSTVGVIGATGSGKTTIIDIILGLLEAQKGTLEIDNQIITKKNLKAWQRSIGYVPQNIYLSDDTVAANIAFGVEPKDINQKNLEKVSKIASLDEFVINELPNQYNTIIGERGIRLSGGQRQRIGIARALYKAPKVLILDEATSALDNQTEQAVMNSINNLSKDITIILIAHRLNTVKNCDVIFKFDKGQLVDQGTYEEIVNSN